LALSAFLQFLSSPSFGPGPQEQVVAYVDEDILEASALVFANHLVEPLQQQICVEVQT